MATNSNIEWTHHTFNPWRGCTKVSAGCANCYADTLSHRNPKTLGVWGPRGTRVAAAESYWREPIKWANAAQEAGERHRVFCASLADVGEGPVTMPAECWPIVQECRRRLENLIEATADSLDWLLLTKRPQNITIFFRPEVLRRCWVGTSVEDQKAADTRIPHLLKCPAAVRFLSCEPLLGPVDLADWLDDPGLASSPDQHIPDRLDIGLHWIIVGGESGPNARPMHPDWARSLRDQCQAAGVAFFFKQWGEWVPAKQSGRYSSTILTGHVGLNGQMNGAIWGTYPPPEFMVRLGKNAAGRLLDGVEHNAMPAAPAEVK